MKLKKDNFHMYYDFGLGNPFNTQDVIRFCIENQDLFDDELNFDDNHCWICDKDGLDKYYVFRFETDSRIELFNNFVSGAQDILRNEENEIQDISFGICLSCQKWIITH